MTVADWVHIFCASKWLQIKVIEKNLLNVTFFQIKETALLECNKPGHICGGITLYKFPINISILL